jgi:hypothetical protein
MVMPERRNPGGAGTILKRIFITDEKKGMERN